MKERPIVEVLDATFDALRRDGMRNKEPWASELGWADAGRSSTSNVQPGESTEFSLFRGFVGKIKRPMLGLWNRFLFGGSSTRWPPSAFLNLHLHSLSGHRYLHFERNWPDVPTVNVQTISLATLGLPLLILAGVGAGVFLLNFDITTKTTIWWFVTSMIILILSFLQGYIFNAQLRSLDQHIVELCASCVKANDEARRIIEVIEENADPHVTVLRSLKEVRFAAADLIEEAIRNQQSSEIYYLGSASLTPSERDLPRPGHAESDELSDVVRYQNALDELWGSNAKVSRFVRLLDDDLFTSRDAKTRVEYLAWLENQVVRLSTNRSYVLYDSRRAPEWGGPRSSILTSKGMLDIIGSGEAGLYLVSTRIPSVLILESKQYLWNVRIDEHKPQAYTGEQAYKLQRRLGALKELHDKRLTREGK